VNRLTSPRALQPGAAARLPRFIAVALLTGAAAAWLPARAQPAPGPTPAPPAWQHPATPYGAAPYAPHGPSVPPPPYPPHTPYSPYTPYSPQAPYAPYPGVYPAPLPLAPGFYAGPTPHDALPGVPLMLAADDAPQRLDNYFAAGGPLERHTGRPGAWYAVVFVPAVHGSVQLWAWQRTRAHQLRLTAIDGWPAHAARQVVPLPLYASATASGRPLVRSTPFALPPDSRADGTFLLVEQWSLVGDRPAPVWLQARSAQPWVELPTRGGAAWWPTAESARPAPRDPLGRAHAPPAPPAAAPPSPLLAPRGTPAVIELPFMQLATPVPRPAPTFDPWWER